MGQGCTRDGYLWGIVRLTTGEIPVGDESDTQDPRRGRGMEP